VFLHASQVLGVLITLLSIRNIKYFADLITFSLSLDTMISIIANLGFENWLLVTNFTLY
jgi:hypothetical protein